MARDAQAFHAIVNALRTLEDDETLLIQSGQPVAILQTHNEAARVLIVNSNAFARRARARAAFHGDSSPPIP